MTPLSRREWEAAWAKEFGRLRKQFPTARLDVLQKAARKYVEGKHGPQPPKAPLVARVGMAIARKKLKEMNMSPMMFRILNALLFGLSSLLAALQAGTPQNTEGWISLVVAALIAAYGKFSSNQTFIAPNRPVWTDEQRVGK